MPPRTTTVRPLGWLAVAAAAAALFVSPPIEAAAASASVSGVNVALSAGVLVFGTIEDTDGTALPGVTVGFCRMIDGAPPCRTATSDSSGAYTVTGVGPADDYVIAILGTGGDDELLGGWVVDGVATGDVSNPPGTSIGPGGLANYTIRIGRRSGPFAIGGTIRLATAHGGTTTVSGAHATVCPATSGWPCYVTTTSSDGRYLFRHLAAGSYRVQLSPRDGANWLPGYAADSPAAAPSEEGARTVTIGAGIVDPTDVDGVLPVGRRIMGRILDARGGPIRTGDVSACPTWGGPCVSGSIRPDGRYVVNGIRSGAWYELSVSLWTGTSAGGRVGPHGYQPESSSGDPFRVEGTDVALPTVRVPDRRLRLAGRVTAADGAPVAGADVWVSGSGENVRATTDATGAYAVRLLAPGRYAATVSVPDGVNLVGGMLGPGGAVAGSRRDAGSWQVGSAVTPRVVSRSPRPGATGVAVDAVVRVRFSVPVLGVSDPMLRLWDLDARGWVPGTVSYDATTRVGTFRPKRALVRGHAYQVWLGSPWSVTYTPVPEDVWSFTVGPASAAAAAVATGASARR